MPWIKLSNKEIEEIQYHLSCIKSDFVSKIYRKLERAFNPIKISSRKGKARGLQKWVCEKISKLIDIPYDQQDDQCLIHSREMGQKNVDIILRGKALELFPFSIECKNAESFNMKGTVEQAKNNQIENTDWMIVYKRKSFKEPVIIIEWGVFEKLFKGE